MSLPDNGAKHKERSVLNRCSQATLGVRLDDNVLSWTESVNHFFLEVGGVLLRVRGRCTGSRFCPKVASVRALASVVPKNLPTNLYKSIWCVDEALIIEVVDIGACVPLAV